MTKRFVKVSTTFMGAVVGLILLPHIWDIQIGTQTWLLELIVVLLVLLVIIQFFAYLDSDPTGKNQGSVSVEMSIHSTKEEECGDE